MGLLKYKVQNTRYHNPTWPPVQHTSVFSKWSAGLPQSAWHPEGDLSISSYNTWVQAPCKCEAQGGIWKAVLMQEARDSKASDPSDCELGQGHHSKAVLWQAQVVHDHCQHSYRAALVYGYGQRLYSFTDAEHLIQSCCAVCSVCYSRDRVPLPPSSLRASQQSSSSHSSIACRLLHLLQIWVLLTLCHNSGKLSYLR